MLIVSGPFNSPQKCTYRLREKLGLQKLIVLPGFCQCAQCWRRLSRVAEVAFWKTFGEKRAFLGQNCQLLPPWGQVIWRIHFRENKTIMVWRKRRRPRVNEKPGLQNSAANMSSFTSKNNFTQLCSRYTSNCSFANFLKNNFLTIIHFRVGVPLGGRGWCWKIPKRGKK